MIFRVVVDSDPMRPQEISRAEWDQLAKVPGVRSAMRLEPDEDGAVLSFLAYGARFRYVGRPKGYVGDLFVLVGDEHPTKGVAVTRDDRGHLRSCQIGPIDQPL